jgi:hypothetical protein
MREWAIRLCEDDHQGLVAYLYDVEGDAEHSLLGKATFTQFQTATDVLVWAVCQWAPLAHLPLR